MDMLINTTTHLAAKYKITTINSHEMHISVTTQRCGSHSTWFIYLDSLEMLKLLQTILVCLSGGAAGRSWLVVRTRYVDTLSLHSAMPQMKAYTMIRPTIDAATIMLERLLCDQSNISQINGFPFLKCIRFVLQFVHLCYYAIVTCNKITTSYTGLRSKYYNASSNQELFEFILIALF